MKKELVLKNLQRSILFKDATPDELKTFAELSTVRIVPKGEYVYRQGEESDMFYVIALGEAELLVEKLEGNMTHVGRVRPGGHFGETTILTQRERTLTVRALFDLVLICFDIKVFNDVLLENPNIHKQLDVTLAERLQVAFHGQAEKKPIGSPEDNTSFEDVLLYDEDGGVAGDKKLAVGIEELWQSKTAILTQRAIAKFAANHSPYLLVGESGTGKRMITRQVHHMGDTESGLYLEIDLREQKKETLDDLLFGRKKNNLPFLQMEQTGLFEQTCGGTIVFQHAELLSHKLQRRILNALKSGIYFMQDSDEPIALQSRMVFVCTQEMSSLEKSGCFLRELWQMLAGEHHFKVSSLREHKRDLPRLINFYLDKYSKEYGKNVPKVSRDSLGLLMNYDWPGNLTELSSVLKRAVMLSKQDEIITDQILLGLPKTEGKWEFNLLRIPFVRKLFESKAFPVVPQIFVGIILLIAILSLFLGPENPDENLGITIAWALGWPLLFISFFVLARMWCSVCTLATPGILLQAMVKPKRKTPLIIKEYSGWIMAILCIIVMWVEIVWNAYDSPFLSGCIILAITIGSMLFSVMYSRRAWCRYLCPLGAINAIFAMPSILELRSNRHLCLNKCKEHSCFRGGSEEEEGCPMFQHPFMVDNNRDCIFCGKCIKNCNNNSIHLNLRLAPQELWNIKVPRKADSFLIVSLVAIFFPFAMNDHFYTFVGAVQKSIAAKGGNVHYELLGSMLFFLNIFLFQAGYYLMVHLQGRVARLDHRILLPFLGYAFIPLLLAGYISVHFNILVSEVWRLIPNIQALFGLDPTFDSVRILSPGATSMLQGFIVLGGLSASMYATYRIISRLKEMKQVESNALVLPFIFLVVFALVLFVVL